MGFVPWVSSEGSVTPTPGNTAPGEGTGVAQSDRVPIGEGRTAMRDPKLESPVKGGRPNGPSRVGAGPGAVEWVEPVAPSLEQLERESLESLVEDGRLNSPCPMFVKAKELGEARWELLEGPKKELPTVAPKKDPLEEFPPKRGLRVVENKPGPFPNKGLNCFEGPTRGVESTGGSLASSSCSACVFSGTPGPMEKNNDVGVVKEIVDVVEYVD